MANFDYAYHDWEFQAASAAGKAQERLESIRERFDENKKSLDS